MIVDTKDAKIGNLVEYAGQVCTVYHILYGVLCVKELMSGKYHDRVQCNAIELTPEILKKFGFKDPCEGKEGDYLQSYKFENFCYLPVQQRMGNRNSGMTLTAAHSYFDRWLPHIKYIHQFQNLYYFLEGKELEYDKDSFNKIKI